MGFGFGNAIAAVEDPHVRACLMRLGNSHHSDNATLSTLVRNAVPVTTYALAATNLSAGAGLTGGGTLAADRTFNVGAGFGITVAADTVAVDQTMVPTWTGIHTFSAKDVHNAGVSLGTSGRLDSSVVDGAGVYSFLYKPTVALTSGTDRWIHAFQDSTGAYGLSMQADSTWQFYGSPGSNSVNAGYININATIANANGIIFAPTINASSGATIAGKASSISGAQFRATGTDNANPSGYVIGGLFAASTSQVTSGNIPTGFIGGFFQGGNILVANSGKTFAELGGWRVVACAPVKNAGTFTDAYGGYIENQAAPSSGMVYTTLSGLIIEEQTRGGTTNNGIRLLNATAGYKAITIRDQNAWIGSAAAGEITIGGTNFRCASTNQGVFGVAAIARPTNAIAAAAFVANTSGIANDTATWGGYTVGQVVQALQNYGILT